MKSENEKHTFAISFGYSLTIAGNTMQAIK
jgi:hypothetical protein